MKVVVDGQHIAQLAIAPTDSPTQFLATWAQWGSVGAGLETLESSGLAHTTNQFHGAIAEVKIWDYPRHNLIAYWPLNEAKGTKARDRGPNHLDATIHRVPWGIAQFPDTSLYLSGHKTWLDVGTLGDFGKHMAQCCVDLWFRTSEVGTLMSLVHVTDSMHKHAMLSIQLNADAEGEYLKNNFLFRVQDTKGAMLSATCVCAQVFSPSPANDPWYLLVGIC